MFFLGQSQTGYMWAKVLNTYIYRLRNLRATIIAFNPYNQV